MQYRKIATPVIALYVYESLASMFPEFEDRGVSIPDYDAALDITGDFTYNKWGGPQTCKEGDLLIYNDGEFYTCDREVFESTYEATEGQDRYVKTALIEAEEATEDGKVTTLEGESAYKAGDFIVTNPGGDQYCIGREKFLSMYEAV